MIQKNKKASMELRVKIGKQVLLLFFFILLDGARI